MSLLNSIVGAVLGGSKNDANAQAGAAGGLGSIISMVAQNPQLLNTVVGMLSNENKHGGLGGLVGKFQQAGMGDVVNSWIGTGQNQAISGDQLTQVLGGDAIGKLAGKAGLPQGQAADIFAQLLPTVIDKLTPQGQAPQGGLGNAGALAGVLGSLLGGNKA